MKKVLVTFCILLCVNTVFSQIKRGNGFITVIFNIDNSLILENDDKLIFNLNKENVFRHLKGKHFQKEVAYDTIKNKIIDLEEFQQNLKIVTSNNDYKILFKGKPYKILIYSQNKNCQNKGTLYEVDELIPIYDED